MNFYQQSTFIQQKRKVFSLIWLSFRLAISMSMFHFMKTSVAALLNPIKSVTVHSAIPTVRPENLAIIGTHDGSFHCDEALAVSMLLLHPSYRGLSCILRTRNPALLSVSCTCQIYFIHKIPAFLLMILFLFLLASSSRCGCGRGL